MGKLHSRAYQPLPLVYPELKIRPRLVHAADTAADRADYARQVLATIEEAHADAAVTAATEASAQDSAWHSVAPVPGATFGHQEIPA